MNVFLKTLCLSQGRGLIRIWPFPANLILGLVLCTVVAGCQTTQNNSHAPSKDYASTSAVPDTNQPSAVHSESVILREGDALKINFSGAPTFNDSPVIRPDGKINLRLVGEVTAAGLTPLDLEKELMKRYEDQIVVREITVAVESYTFNVYVTGAVMHAQKVQSNHPITILTAIMEAGGPDYSKANLKSVTVLRQENGVEKRIAVNVKDMISGTSKEAFYMKPGDMIIVKERFSWF